MTGLGLGSLAGGHVADRLSPLRCVLLFIAAELAVAAFGLASRAIFYDWMYLRLGPVGLDPPVRAILVFATLLWPTFWMGVSLPVLSRAITPQIGGAARRVGHPLRPEHARRRRGSVRHDLAAVSADRIRQQPGLGRRPERVRGPGGAAARLQAGSHGGRDAIAVRRLSGCMSAHRRSSGWPFAVWIALYGLAGFQALSLEIIWFRLLGVMMKSSAFTFGTLLTIFLTGLGVGAALGSRLLRNVRRPGRAFLLLQAFVGLYAGASILALVACCRRWTPPAALWAVPRRLRAGRCRGGVPALWSPRR